MHSLGTIETSSGTVTLREAVVDDVPSLVELLAADQLGSARESAGANGEHFNFLFVNKLTPNKNPFTRRKT